MAKKPQTRYAAASSELGLEALKIAGNEIKALLGLVETRAGFRKIESMWAVRDACSMLSANELDLQDIERELEIEQLQSALKK